jgi:hypothetical protein
MKTAIMIVITLVLGSSPLYSVAGEQPPPISAQEQPEVLTRGPVHEAFAEPVNLQIQAGLVVSKQPPAHIEEIPPAERPTGDQYVWIPGYWSWDRDRNDYIWVSACWRAAPPNMSWVPGYWSQATGGWEWVAGFWTPAGAQEIEYLPAPPALEDMQPPGPRPSPDNIWVPSCQYWYQDHYVQRPGYWLAAHPDWVWEPSHYVWTPRGYVFLPGHWDYSLERRGVLFAPVYFPQSVHVREGFSYSPSIVIDIGMLQVNLFTYPRYSHYYFGDYYDDAYLSIGIFPRHEAERIHTWYDPIYVYDRWHHRDEPRWEENERHEYDLRHSDKDLRPSRTYHEMETRQASMPEQQRKNFRMAEPLTTVAANKETPLKFERIDTKEQQNITAHATEASKFREERNRWESAPITQKTVQPPTERKGSVTQPSAEHKEPVSAPMEQKGSAKQPSKDKEPVSAPMEQKGSVTKPADNTPAVVSPREVRVTRPEKVKIPKPPIADKSVDSDKSKAGPPPKPPAEERQQVGDTRDKDKGNDKDKDKNKNK